MNRTWKILSGVGLVIVVALVATFWLLPTYIDRLINGELVNACSLAAGTECSVTNTQLRLLPQNLTIRDLKIANPDGFKASYILEIGSTEAGIKLRSLDQDPVVLHTVIMKDVHLEYQDAKGFSNLKELLHNTHLAAENAEHGLYAEKKIQIDEIIIEGATVHLLIAPMWPINEINLHLVLPTVHIVNPRNELGEYMTIEELLNFVAAEIAWEIVNHPHLPRATVHAVLSSLANVLRFFLI